MYAACAVWQMLRHAAGGAGKGRMQQTSEALRSYPADHAGEAAGPDKEAALLESWKAYKTGFQQGVALFNKKPKKGIAFMQEQVCYSQPR